MSRGVRSIGLTRGAIRATVLLVALLPIGACGGGEGGGGAGPTFSPTRTPTATLPSELPSELPSPTRSPSRTDRPDQTTPAEPDETTPAEEEDSATEPAEQEASEPDEETSTEDDGVPSWVWWLLSALIVGSAVVIPLLVRSRRRNAWRRELGEAEADLVWLAHELLPELRQVGSREQMAGGWAVGQTRVAAAEDRLTVLESTAPDDTDRERARSLRDASRLARVRMDQITGPGTHDTWALDLDAVIADLDVVVGSGGPAPRTP